MQYWKKTFKWLSLLVLSAVMPVLSAKSSIVMQTPKQLLQAYYQSFNEGKKEAFLSLLHDEVIHDLNQGPREVGKERFRQFMDRMNACYQEKVSEIVIMLSEQGDRAAVEYIVEGKYMKTDSGLPSANGQSYRLKGGAFFEFKDGKIFRVTNYYNLQDWLEQVKK